MASRPIGVGEPRQGQNQDVLTVPFGSSVRRKYQRTTCSQGVPPSCYYFSDHLIGFLPDRSASV